MDWVKISLGEVVKGDIIDCKGSFGVVESVGHTEKPGGSVLLQVQGSRPVQGNPTEKCEVYR